ncbi:MAG: MotA/TolQ/ExbB proton channel family protein [Pseudomonadota bacterium]
MADDTATAPVSGEGNSAAAEPALVDGEATTAAVIEPALDSAATGPEATAQAVSALVQASELAEAGGPVVLILGMMSVFALAIVLAKGVQFSAAGIGDRKRPRDALKLFRAGRAGEAFTTARASRSPTAKILARAMEGQARGISEPRIREECYAEAQIEVEALRGWMRPLEVIASLAPLLGLFGTVLGMIEAFSQLEQAGSQVDPSILSGGIWEALLTTAVGLAVAIPTVAAANWFERRIERVEHDIDTSLAGLFATEWMAPEAESLAPRAARETERSLDLGAHGFPAATPGE